MEKSEVSNISNDKMYSDGSVKFVFNADSTRKSNENHNFVLDIDVDIENQKIGVTVKRRNLKGNVTKKKAIIDDIGKVGYTVKEDANLTFREAEIIKQKELIGNNTIEVDYSGIVEKYNAIFCKPSETQKNEKSIAKSLDNKSSKKATREKVTKGVSPQMSTAERFRRWCKMNETTMDKPEKENKMTKTASFNSLMDRQTQKSNQYVPNHRTTRPRSKSCAVPSKDNHNHPSLDETIEVSSNENKMDMSSISKKEIGKCSNFPSNITKTSYSLTHREHDKCSPCHQRGDLLNKKMQSMCPVSSDTNMEEYLQPSPEVSPSLTRDTSIKSVNSICFNQETESDKTRSPCTVTAEEILDLINKCPLIEKLIQKYTSVSSDRVKQDEESPFQLTNTNKKDCKFDWTKEFENCLDKESLIQDISHDGIDHNSGISRSSVYDNTLFPSRRSEAYINLYGENMVENIHSNRPKKNLDRSDDIVWKKLDIQNCCTYQKCEKGYLPCDNGVLSNNMPISQRNEKGESNCEVEKHTERQNSFDNSYCHGLNQINRIQKLDNLINTLWPE